VARTRRRDFLDLAHGEAAEPGRAEPDRTAAVDHTTPFTGTPPPGTTELAADTTPEISEHGRHVGVLTTGRDIAERR